MFRFRTSILIALFACLFILWMLLFHVSVSARHRVTLNRPLLTPAQSPAALVLKDPCPPLDVSIAGHVSTSTQTAHTRMGARLSKRRRTSIIASAIALEHCSDTDPRFITMGVAGPRWSQNEIEKALQMQYSALSRAHNCLPVLYVYSDTEERHWSKQRTSWGQDSLVYFFSSVMG